MSSLTLGPILGPILDAIPLEDDPVMRLDQLGGFPVLDNLEFYQLTLSLGLGGYHPTVSLTVGGAPYPDSTFQQVQVLA